MFQYLTRLRLTNVSVSRSWSDSCYCRWSLVTNLSFSNFGIIDCGTSHHHLAANGQAPCNPIQGNYIRKKQFSVILIFWWLDKIQRCITDVVGLPKVPDSDKYLVQFFICSDLVYALAVDSGDLSDVFVLVIWRRSSVCLLDSTRELSVVQLSGICRAYCHFKVEDVCEWSYVIRPLSL